MRTDGEAVARGVAQRGLALWIHMVALELGKTKLPPQVCDVSRAIFLATLRLRLSG